MKKCSYLEREAIIKNMKKVLTPWFFFIYLLETVYYIVSHKKKAMPIVKSANNSRPVYTLTLLANAYGTHCSIYVLKMKNIYDLTC